jgi:hypothetical protein
MDGSEVGLSKDRRSRVISTHPSRTYTPPNTGRCCACRCWLCDSGVCVWGGGAGAFAAAAAAAVRCSGEWAALFAVVSVLSVLLFDSAHEQTAHERKGQ